MTNPEITAAVALKACPFCGGEAGPEHFEPTLDDLGRRATISIFCGSCHASTGAEISLEDATRAWNQRSPTPADVPTDVVERVARALERAWDHFGTLPPIDFTPDEARALATAALRAALPEMVEVLRPFANFIEKFDAKPMRTDDEFYAIHMGTEWEASLRLSDLRRVRELLGRVG